MIRRSVYFIPALALLTVIFLVARPATAEEEEAPYPTGPEAGRALAAKLCSIRPEENASVHGFLKILGRGHKIPAIPFTCQTTIGKANWSVTYLTAASGTNVAEKLTVIFSTNGPNQYLYARASAIDTEPGEPKSLSGAQADIPLADTDFWLSDLGMEFLRWPEQVRLPGVMRSSRPCYVLVSINPHPAPGGYSRVKTWIEKESGQPMEAESYRTDNTNKVFKSYSLGSVTGDHGHYQVKDLEITNGKSRTQQVNELEEKP
jgi:hypothetical protein